MAEGSLKKGNIPWLVGLALLDLVILAASLYPKFLDMKLEQSQALKVLALSALVVVVPIITDSFSHDAKARMVFWRWANPLPGSRSFSFYLIKQPHIDIGELRRNIGDFPESESRQSSRWYALYSLVRDRANVIETHKKYLRYRDMTAMSVVLLLVATAALLLFDLPWRGSALFLGLQSALAIWLCRIAGARFVTTVLAVHASERVADAFRS